MKVSIIAFSDLKKCPYINPYVSFCREAGIDLEVIYFNRSGEEQIADYPLVEIKWMRGKKKWANFLHFRRELKTYLKSTERDFVIVLTTMPAVLIGGYLRRHYKGRYLVDIRDFTYENVGPYYMFEKKALAGAAMNVISSPGFKNFLPKGEYTLCHNASAAYKEPNNAVFKRKDDGRITIGYVGSIAYKSNCKKLIEHILRDERFDFYLYGDETGGKELTDYVASLDCPRIKAFGGYKPHEKVGIMESVDILFNVYGNDRPLVMYALSNKLYDACYMKLPVLTSSGTSMSEELGDYAFDVDFNDEKMLDKLYEWYQTIDGEAFGRYAKEYLAKVFEDQEKFYTKLKETILGTSAL